MHFPDSLTVSCRLGEDRDLGSRGCEFQGLLPSSLLLSKSLTSLSLSLLISEMRVMTLPALLAWREGAQWTALPAHELTATLRGQTHGAFCSKCFFIS